MLKKVFNQSNDRMNSLNRVVYLLILLNIGLLVHGQQVSKNEVTENIKLQTDRDLYFCGEDILFTADYFINNKKALPILSNILYLELIESTSKKIIVQKKFKISEFKVNGHIEIPKDIVSGSYYLRVYTQYQRNFSTLNYSFHILTILNPNFSLQKKAVLGNADSVYVAVEGNVLLDEVENTIVVKLPKSIISTINKIYISNNRDEIVKDLNLNSSGFIRVNMSLVKSDRYKIVVVKNTGDSLVKRLPIIQSNGIQTNTELDINSFNYKIQLRGSYAIKENYDFKIEILSSDLKSIYNEEVNIKESNFNRIFSKNMLCEGINYIVLKDKNNKVKKINSVFNFIDQHNNIDVITSKDIYKPGERIEASVRLKNSSQASITDISISVTQAGTKIEDHDFFPDLYYYNSNDLEDYINFSIPSDYEIQHQMMIFFDETLNSDLFYNELESLRNEEIKYYPEIRDQSIKGILRNKNTKEPIPYQNIYLVVLFNNPQIHISKTKKDGEFAIIINDIYRKNDIFLCAEPFEGVDSSEILVTRPFSKDYEKVSSKVFLDLYDADLIQELYINSQIQEIRNKRQKRELVKEDQMSFFNINDDKITILPDLYIGIENMQDLFFEVIPSVAVRKHKDQYSFNILSEYGNILSGNPLLLLDYIPIFNINSIMELDPSQLEKIEIINKPYILGSNTFNGVIMLKTNSDDFTGIKMPETATFIEYEALELHDSNFNNDINDLDSLTSFPDFRTVLYWNPQLKLTGKEHEVSFIASDRKGLYNIIVKGYNTEGHPYYAKKQIKIE